MSWGEIKLFLLIFCENEIILYRRWNIENSEYWIEVSDFVGIRKDELIYGGKI